MRVPEFALRRPVTILVATAAIVVLGVVSLARLKTEFLPNIDFPFIGVWAPYPNSVPAEAEKQIARPIEEIMATLGDVNQIFADSDADGVFVGVFFDFGRSVDVLRMEVEEKLEQVKPLLPTDLRDTYIFTFNSNDIPIMVGRISARGRDLAGSYDLLERRIINPLQRVEGVGRVEVGGIEPKSIRIYLFLDKIVEHSVDVERLFELLNANNVDLSVGRVRNGNQRIAVRSLGQFRSLEELADLQVTPTGLKLRDIAEIDFSEPDPGYYRHLNGEPAIAFEVQRASGANVVEVSRRVHEVLRQIGQDPALEGIDVVLFFDQAADITNSLNSLLQGGLIGSALAILVLLIFLRHLRTTLIVSIAIPFSVIATCVVLYLTGRTLNLLSMMGLMLAVGMLVDNAIVVLESITRRQERGEDARTAARTGSNEVGMAVTASTLTSIIVFAPIVLSKGNQIGVWLSEVGLTISTTLIFSLLVCLTLVPLMAARTPVRGGPGEFRLLTRLRERYLRVLGWTALRHPKRTGLVFIPLFLALTVAAMKVSGFKPETFGDRGERQDDLRMELRFTDNTNVYGVRQRIGQIEEFLLPRADSLGVESVYTFFTDNIAEFSLYFPEGTSRSEKEMRDLRKYLRESLPVLAGVEYRFGDEQSSGHGVKEVAVTLFGEDTELLSDLAGEVQRRLTHLPNVTEVRNDAQQGRDEVRIVLNREQSGRQGIDSRALAQILGLTFRGVPLRQFQGPEREVDMDIVLEPSERRNIDNLTRLPVSYRDGKPILLGQVASFEVGRGPQRIHRENQKTALTVTASYEGDKFNDFRDEVERVMKTLEMPAGYSWSFSREMRQAQREQNQMGMDILLALACVYLVMAALFESYLHPLVIMQCIPFAGLGVIWSLMLSNTPFNIMAMIGIVILIGVVVNNGIVMVDHINGLRRRGLDRATAIVEGCRDRFRPILMTAATTILGLAPLAFGKANLSGAYYFPLARAIMGGLATGTVLTLVVLPTFYVLAEDALAVLRRVTAWGMGRAPLPWRATGGAPLTDA
jgi:HAE1 family hydrophobic/amphiphilic exporter-1